MAVAGFNAGHPANLAQEPAKQGSQDEDIEECGKEDEQKGRQGAIDDGNRNVACRTHQGH